MINGWNWSEELIRGTVRSYFKTPPPCCRTEQTREVLKILLLGPKSVSPRVVTPRAERWPKVSGTGPADSEVANKNIELEVPAWQVGGSSPN